MLHIFLFSIDKFFFLLSKITWNYCHYISYSNIHLFSSIFRLELKGKRNSDISNVVNKISWPSEPRFVCKYFNASVWIMFLIKLLNLFLDIALISSNVLNLQFWTLAPVLRETNGQHTPCKQPFLPLLPQISSWWHTRKQAWTMKRFGAETFRNVYNAWVGQNDTQTYKVDVQHQHIIQYLRFL